VHKRGRMLNSKTLTVLKQKAVNTSAMFIFSISNLTNTYYTFLKILRPAICNDSKAVGFNLQRPDLAPLNNNLKSPPPFNRFFRRY
jgi:hypothetical protein